MARKKVEPVKTRKVKTTKTTYHIFEKSDRGELVVPKIRGWGSCCCDDDRFSTYGYDSFEEATKAIEDESEYGGYFIIPQISVRVEYVD